MMDGAGRGEEDAVEWPAGAEAKALIVRLSAQRMASTLADLTAVFTAALDAAIGSAEQEEGVTAAIVDGLKVEAAEMRRWAADVVVRSYIRSYIVHLTFS